MLIALTCTDCRTEYKHDAQGGRRPERCPPCRIVRARLMQSESTRRFRERHPERAREQMNRYNRKRLADPEHLRRKREDAMRHRYGLEPEQIQAMRDAQGDLCAICRRVHIGRGDRLHIDHDHVTGKVRGLLCMRCNTMIGLADDDLDRLRAAAAYIRKHRKEADRG